MGSRFTNGGRMPAPAEPESDLESDQTGSDLDQTGSDLDQTGSDTDRVMSQHDEVSSAADRRASDRDQAASDRDLATHDQTTVVLQRVHDASRAERRQSNVERDETALARARTTAERFETASRRDETARLRDLAAKARDAAAAERDRAEEMGDQLLGHPPGAEVQVRAATAVRARAAADRAQAARDREQAAREREQAARERDEARVDLEQAHLDDLTGTYRRQMGSVALQHELDRARRSGNELTLAFVDVDGLKRVNDSQGHAAGDTLLREVAVAMRSKLRSYDPIVRFGGDEFVCALSDANLDQAEKRFDEIRRQLAEAHPDGSISVGLSVLGPDDSLDELLARGDQALYEARQAAANN
jgi:diguanylate cyclase (GGDEF)-like protein